MHFQPLWPIVGPMLILVESLYSLSSNHVCCKTKQEILLRHMGIINIYMVIVIPEYMLHCTSSSLHLTWLLLIGSLGTAFCDVTVFCDITAFCDVTAFCNVTPFCDVTAFCDITAFCDVTALWYKNLHKIT